MMNYTSLIVYNAHKKQFHAGVNSTLSAIRQEYWIPIATAWQYIRIPVPPACKQHIGKPHSTPDPAPLPVVHAYM